MRIGLIEFLLILAIASLTVGPRVALFVDRWMRRANRANAMAARRRAEYAAQMAAERDALFNFTEYPAGASLDALGGEYHTPEGISVWLADVELEPYQALLVKNK